MEFSSSLLSQSINKQWIVEVSRIIGRDPNPTPDGEQCKDLDTPCSEKGKSGGEEQQSEDLGRSGSSDLLVEASSSIARTLTTKLSAISSLSSSTRDEGSIEDESKKQFDPYHDVFDEKTLDMMKIGKFSCCCKKPLPPIPKRVTKCSYNLTEQFNEQHHSFHLAHAHLVPDSNENQVRYWVDAHFYRKPRVRIKKNIIDSSKKDDGYGGNRKNQPEIESISTKMIDAKKSTRRYGGKRKPVKKKRQRQNLYSKLPEIPLHINTENSSTDKQPVAGDHDKESFVSEAKEDVDSFGREIESEEFHPIIKNVIEDAVKPSHGAKNSVLNDALSTGLIESKADACIKDLDGASSNETKPNAEFQANEKDRDEEETGPDAEFQANEKDRGEVETGPDAEFQASEKDRDEEETGPDAESQANENGRAEEEQKSREASNWIRAKRALKAQQRKEEVERMRKQKQEAKLMEKLKLEEQEKELRNAELLAQQRNREIEENRKRREAEEEKLREGEELERQMLMEEERKREEAKLQAEKLRKISQREEEQLALQKLREEEIEREARRQEQEEAMRKIREDEERRKDEERRVLREQEKERQLREEAEREEKRRKEEEQRLQEAEKIRQEKEYQKKLADWIQRQLFYRDLDRWKFVYDYNARLSRAYTFSYYEPLPDIVDDETDQAVYVTQE